MLIQLFTSNFYISSFTFGGGFVIITLMKRKYVDEFHWITDSEMLDITALAQSSPGPIAVNAAILIGWRMAGFVGMLISVIGTILPPMIILSIVSVFYNCFATNVWIAALLKGMQAGVAAVILDVACSLSSDIIKTRSTLNLCLMITAFILSLIGINVVYIILGAVLFGVARVAWMRKKAHSV